MTSHHSHEVTGGRPKSVFPLFVLFVSGRQGLLTFHCTVRGGRPPIEVDYDNIRPLPMSAQILKSVPGERCHAGCHLEGWWGGFLAGSRARNGGVFTKKSRIEFHEPSAGLGELTHP